MAGSTEFTLTWRLKATPAKRPIFRLAASTRRISATGSTGWPTPRSRAAGPDFAKRDRSDTGMDLPALARELAGWATPTARDRKNGKASEETHERNARPLNEVAVQMAGWATPRMEDGESCGNHPGKMDSLTGMTRVLGTNGSLSDPTQPVSIGGLNPEFVCWLQGYPPEYLSCAPSAIALSRKKRQK